MVQIDLDFYIKKALEQWQQFNQRIEGESSHPFHDPSDSPDIFTVPEKGLFLEGENIAISIQAKQLLNPDVFSSNQHEFLHHHNFFEFNYVVRGIVKNQLENAVMLQDNSKLLIMHPYAIHDPQLQTPDTVLFNILIKKNWVEQVFVNLLSFNQSFFNFFLDAVYGLNHINPYLIFDNTPRLIFLIHQMIKEYFDHNLCYQQVLFAKLIELFAELTRQQSDHHQKENVKILQNRDLSSVLHYIQNNYATVTLKEVADKFYFSTSYLSKLIKANTNLNFTEHITHLKLQSACNYLTHSDLPIDKITEIIGYNDSSYFSKVFRKQYGMTPKQYRQIQISSLSSVHD